jgi:hypothetical protein
MEDTTSTISGVAAFSIPNGYDQMAGWLLAGRYQ